MFSPKMDRNAAVSACSWSGFCIPVRKWANQSSRSMGGGRPPCPQPRLWFCWCHFLHPSYYSSLAHLFQGCSILPTNKTKLIESAYIHGIFLISTCMDEERTKSHVLWSKDRMPGSRFRWATAHSGGKGMSRLLKLTVYLGLGSVGQSVICPTEYCVSIQ